MSPDGMHAGWKEDPEVLDREIERRNLLR